MHKEQNRRRFMSLVGGGFAGAVGMPCAAFADPQEPDLIVYNAKVWTVDNAMPAAQAFAVRAGRFVAVGSNDIKSLAGKQTQSYDAKGMMVVPGFIDAHNHGGGEALLYDVMVGNPYAVEQVSIDSIIAKLKAKRALNVHDLDKASTDHPIMVLHRGGHTGFFNSKAFQMAGITAGTPN